jgi:Tfp pilus assembly protein PilF
VSLEVGDAQSAVESLQRALRIDPNHNPSQIKIAELMALQPQMDIVQEAERRARAALDAAQGNVEAITALALAELRLGKTAAGEAHLREVLNNVPSGLKAAILLAISRLSNKDQSGAEAVLTRAVANSPSSAEAFVVLGRYYLLVGDDPKAEVQLRRAVEIDAKYGPALLDLATLEFRTKRQQDAGPRFRILSELDARYRALYGAFLFETGRKDEAITELARLTKAHGTDRNVRSALVAAYLSTRRLAEAERVLTEALDRNSQDIDALQQRAQIYLLAGKFNQAQNDVNQVLQFAPNSATAHFLLAHVHGSRGARFNRRHELARVLELDPGMLPARIELAQALIEANDARAALDVMNAAPEPQRNSAAAIVQRNWSLLALGDTADLEKGIESGLRFARAPDLMLQDALVKLRKKDLPAGRKRLTDILASNVEDLRALDVLARTYSSENQPATALQKVREYAAQRPQSAAMQQFLGNWLLANGNEAEARAAFNNAKIADPSAVGPKLALAQADILSRNFDSARATLSGIIGSDQDNLSARLLLGMVEEATGNFAAAMQHYQRVVDREPGDIVALNNLAYRLASDGKQADEALKYAQRAAELSPNRPEVNDTLGWALYHKGVYRSAIKYLEASTGAEKKPIRMYHLAMAYFKAGDRVRGRQTLDAALRIDPALPEAKMAEAVAKEGSQGN